MARKQQDSVITIDELAEYLKLSKSTLYHLARRGDVPGQKISRHWRFHKEAVVEWLKSDPEHGARPDSIDADMREDTRLRSARP